MTLVIAKTLDCKGLACPLPIVKTAQAMKLLGAGDVIEVLATDPGATKDFAAWAKATGNPLVEATSDGGVLRFVLMKKKG
jgi:tRNA 2-thiouridine synthesizing protein A